MQCIMRLRVPQTISKEASYKHQRDSLMVIRFRSKKVAIKQVAELTPQEMRVLGLQNLPVLI